jgi:asparaginyl-tRNA synthetase
MPSTRLRPPGSWKTPSRHYLEVLDHPWYRIVAQLQDTVVTETTRFWSARSARMLLLPITTGSISSPMGAGSDSTPVKIDLFGQPTYLADSMQFMLEFGCRLSPAGCYYVMPSFRGERPDPRHLSQFIHSEAEIMGTLDDVIDAVEDYLRHLTMRLLDDSADLIAEAAGDVSHLEGLAGSKPFNRITFDDAVQELAGDPRYVRVSDEGWRTMTNAGEQRLMKLLGEPLWLTHLDAMSVPFYQAAEENGAARCADLLLGIGETVGAGERHVHVGGLDAALRSHGVAPDEYEWYRNLKERYPLQTAGFGMGVERFLLWVLRHDDIRDIPLLLRANGESILP